MVVNGKILLLSRILKGHSHTQLLHIIIIDLSPKWYTQIGFWVTGEPWKHSTLCCIVIGHCRIPLKQNTRMDSTAVHQVTPIPTSLRTNQMITIVIYPPILGTGQQRGREHLATRVSRASMTTTKSQKGYDHWRPTFTLQIWPTTTTQNIKCSSSPVRAYRVFAAHASVLPTKSR